MISESKWKRLRQWMSDLAIMEDDLIESFILASGRGGQKVQKTASCVHLRHEKSGLIIKCSDARSRELNRYTARYRLCEKIETIQLKEKSREQKRIEKIRRQKAKRSKRAQKKVLDDKSHQGKLKQSRQKPRMDA